MSNLAQTYNLLGRLQDSLRLNEMAHEFLQRVMPADDPGKGGVQASLSLLHLI